MSTNNLLSLLVKTQNARGHSLTSRQGLSPSFSFMSRSTSTSTSKFDSTSVQRTTPLYKLAHLLNIKVKQNYYFSFCRIEQIYKTQQKNKETILPIQTLKPPQENANDHHFFQQNYKIETKKEKIREGVSKTVDFLSALQTKQSMRSDGLSVSNCFYKLLRHSRKIKSVPLFEKTILSIKRSYFKQLAHSANSKQKNKIRCQIVFENIFHLYLKNIQIAQLNIKNHQKYQITPIPEDSWKKITENSQQITIEPQIVNFQTNTSNFISYRSQIIEELPISRPKKIKIKQKKVNTAKPITSPSLKFIRTAIKAAPYQDIPLSSNQTNNFNNDEHMKRFIHLKPQPLIDHLPDLNDNCSIFREVPQLFNFPQTRSELTYQTNTSQSKQSSDLNCMDDLPTQRYTKYQETSKEKSHTPSNFKHKSIGNITRELNELEQNSPSIKIEQLLKNMQSISNYKTIQKQKRMVNINLPRHIYEHPSPLNTLSKTPSRDFTQISNFRSENKQNIGQRLITERPKPQPQKPQEDIPSKTKSTVLVRQRRSKAQKTQLFTARKMKIQIQNIINKRNKLATHRQQTKQLK